LIRDSFAEFSWEELLVGTLAFLGFLGLKDVQFKFSIFSLVGFRGSPCFPGKIVERKLLFKVMAGTALGCIPKHFPLVKHGLLFNVTRRVKVPVNMTASAVIVDDFIAVRWNKIAIKGLFYYLRITTHTHPYYDQNPKPLHLK